MIDASPNDFQEEKVKAWVQPSENITFVCSKNQIVGIVKIFLEAMNKRNYQFQIKTTNKAHYKLSQPNGFISKSPKSVYIYLRHISSLERTLNDKFKVTITDQKRQRIILTRKFGVIIESNLNSQKEEVSLESNNTSVSRSVYTNPSVIGEGSLMRMSVLRMSNIEERAIWTREKKSKPKQTLKDKLNQSIQVLEKRKNKQTKLEREIKNKKASARFMIYLLLMLILFGFVAGIQVKKISKSRVVASYWDKLPTFT